ncbi:patatin-like phospholipase family protein [Clostridium sp. AL.422]|uniref:patatin-like phospholipase family protein n=1 Tax=Clostridium TaxID=1485 RepID=UPI00293DD0C7|nr:MULTISPECIES: patatin-like phospholipase family protein [unclassified Clostridium]MDV4150094.1 patatin-like phospholipase family protein [Clostridium sp. AL.422]
MKKFKILSFDGGGIKGALSIEILSRIVDKYPHFLYDIDLFTGTSTGSIIAALLAKGVPIATLKKLYSSVLSKDVFSNSKLNFIKPKYSNTALKNILSDYFDENFKINDFKKFIFIPAFYLGDTNTTSWQPVFFNNLSENSTSYVTAIDAILASTAAPTYFPSYKNYIDGGVVANSPTAISLIYTLASLKKYKIEDIVLLSIGTGDSPEKITGSTKKWGILQWSFHPFAKMKSPLLALLMDGMTNLEDMYCREFLKNNYFRISPRVSKFIELDDYRFINYLKEIGRSCDLKSLFEYINNSYLR